MLKFYCGINPPSQSRVCPDLFQFFFSILNLFAIWIDIWIFKPNGFAPFNEEVIFLDIMALARYCICKEVDDNKRNDARRNFSNTLSISLVFANIENRLNKNFVIFQFSTRSAIDFFLKKPMKVGWIIYLIYLGLILLFKMFKCCMPATFLIVFFFMN